LAPFAGVAGSDDDATVRLGLCEHSGLDCSLPKIFLPYTLCFHYLKSNHGEAAIEYLCNNCEFLLVPVGERPAEVLARYIFAIVCRLINDGAAYQPAAQGS